MNRNLTQQERDTLEKLVDATTVQVVLEALSEICGEKAAHIYASYQDTALARDWRSAEGAIGILSTTPDITRISHGRKE